MKLSSLLRREAIIVPIKNYDKKLLIEELLDAAGATGEILDRTKALQALLDREALGSTGLENGLAIPHARTNAVNGIVMALGVAPQGIDFQSADGRPCNLFFLLLASEEYTTTYVQVLAQIVRLNQLTEFRSSALKASSAEEVLSALRKAEE
jgi:mannitol/fructose-specific phosphotransferase system IIA component (Ntr-type)